MKAGFFRQRVLLSALAAIVIIVVPLAVVWGISAAGYALAFELGVLAIARVVLPADVLGALVVRRRMIDVATLAVLAVAIASLSGTSAL